MAALVRSEILLRDILSPLKVHNISRYSSLPPKKKPPKKKPAPQIYHDKQRLLNRGYLRPVKTYVPPPNVEQLFNSIILEHAEGLSLNSELKEPLVSYKILVACYKTFSHGVPNSLLHNIKNVGDILEFYKTPVDDLTPIQHLSLKDLPPNIHIQLEPKRFDPADPMFNGVSAYPQSATIVSNIKAKRKFQSTEAQNWTKDWREKSLGYIKW